MPTVSFGFNLGKIPDQGEDSDPILRVGPDLGLVGVFDGMGGAGGTVYETPDGPRTGAYLASRVARDVVERRMLELLEPQWNLDGPATAVELHKVLDRALKERLEELKAPVSGLRSKLVRALPTTMALLALQRAEGSQYACHVFWAGDSRAYVVHPEQGVRQVTTDDIRSDGDAMHNLSDDSPMDNTISADTEFRVNYRRLDLETPYLAVAATDGCFHYLPSPMHFEQLLLSTLREAADAGGWQKALESRISAVTGDDAAMALLGVGADFEGFQKLFADRGGDVEKRFVTPLDELDAQVARAERELAGLRERQAALRAELWRDYKPGYERYLGEEES